MCTIVNIIFLDVDGVLNCQSTSDRTPCGKVGIDDRLVEKLAEIVKSTESQIVITSDWKTLWDNQSKDGLHPDALYLIEKLSKQGLHISDRTLDRGKGDRGYGIRRWVKRFPEIERWVVLDDKVFDDYAEEKVMEHLVLTDETLGLTDDDVKSAIKLINGKHRHTEKK